MKNGVRIVAGLVLLVIPLLIPVGEGRDLAPVWSARYNGPDNSGDQAQDIAVDGSGNVYVTGNVGIIDGSGDYNCDYATIKYNTNGKRLWVATYNGPGSNLDEACAIAVDRSGNVYITGSSRDSGYDWDYATIKYSTNGKQLWVARYNGPGNGSDYAVAIAVDGSGNVYVTGSSTRSDNTNTTDYATIKYNTNGKQLWVARYDDGGGDACAIAVDGSGNVYVTGTTGILDLKNNYSCDYATIKYNTNGKRLWVAIYNGPGNYYDEPYAIAVDKSGNVYVTGFSYGSGTACDYATIKYNPNGKQLWVARYNGPGNRWDNAYAIAVDGSGNVYVTGSSEGSGPHGDYDYGDYATIKYNTNGIQLWVARYNGPAKDPSSDDPNDMALDGSGNVYVTGSITVSSFDSDYATIKYSPNGKQLWVKRYNGLGNSDDSANAIAVDKSGNVYVTGESFGSGTSYDYLTLKY